MNELMHRIINSLILISQNQFPVRNDKTTGGGGVG